MSTPRLDRGVPEADRVRARFASVVEFSHDAIFTTSPASVIETWNAGAERFYGYSTPESLGSPPQAITR